MGTTEKREFLRHFIATLAYRLTKVLHNAPEDFATFQAGQGVRTPLAIMAHMNLLMDLSNRQFDVTVKRLDSNRTRTWQREITLFYTLIQRLDNTIAQGIGPRSELTNEQILQGPLSDAMTHVGQMATLRRLAGSPIKGESYWKADIRVGQVGEVQPLQK